jgi:hypothetical protein
MAFELLQNGIVALWETETRHQPLRRATSGHMTDQVSYLARPASQPGKRPGDPRQQAGRGLRLAPAVAASPSIHLDVKRDDYTLHRQSCRRRRHQLWREVDRDAQSGHHRDPNPTAPHYPDSVQMLSIQTWIPPPGIRCIRFPWIISGNVSSQFQTATRTQIEEEPISYSVI